MLKSFEIVVECSDAEPDSFLSTDSCQPTAQYIVVFFSTDWSAASFMFDSIYTLTFCQQGGCEY